MPSDYSAIRATTPAKITVPADFGVENLECEFHNNISLRLQDETDFRANSTILSYNSPVFRRIFVEFNQLSQDMVDFETENVKFFIRALYAGKIVVRKENFRDFYKMSHVFNVNWVREICENVWSVTVEDEVPAKGNFATLKWLFDEAIRSFKTTKSRKLVDFMTDRMKFMQNKESRFLEPYTEDLTVLTTAQLAMVIRVCNPHPDILLKVAYNKISTGKAMEPNYKDLITHIDLTCCFKRAPELFEETFDLIFEIVKDTVELNEMIRVYRKATQKVRQDMISAAKISVKLPNVLLPGAKFQSKGWSHNVEDFFKVIEKEEAVTNLYLFIEVLYLVYYKNEDLVQIAGKIEDFRIKKGWSKISPEFLEKWFTGVKAPDIIKAASNQSLCALSNLKVVGKSLRKNPGMRSFLTEKQTFSFEIDDPIFLSCHPCNRPGKCGFILETLPIDPDKDDQGNSFGCHIGSETFGINLCVGQGSYLDTGIHFHEDYFGVEDIHVVLGFEDGLLGMTFLSWEKSGDAAYYSFPPDSDDKDAEFRSYPYILSGEDKYNIIAFVAIDR